ncbi:hypothetical protein SDC9_148389 [bioreactor metagenome]|uniref:Uncharacterized protein n=1 Tax=bioreactor metagenome TaxID=1076179 RepID=A0A645EKV1_9ZZZZ
MTWGISLVCKNKRIQITVGILSLIVEFVSGMMISYLIFLLWKEESVLKDILYLGVVFAPLFIMGRILNLSIKANMIDKSMQGIPENIE